LDYIYEQQKKYPYKSDLEKLVIAIFFYSSSTWTLAFCGNVLELIEKQKVIEDGDFIEWTDLDKNLNINVFIEQNLLPELELKDQILIDVAIGEIKGVKIGMLFIKQSQDVYG